MKVLILTQNECPRCNAQKMFMSAALGGIYDRNLTYINKEDSIKDYDFWVGVSDTQQTPTTIFVKEGDVVESVSGFNPAKLKKAFEKHFKD